MVKPVNHDFSSKVYVGLEEGAKGAAKWTLGTAAVIGVVAGVLAGGLLGFPVGVAAGLATGVAALAVGGSIAGLLAFFGFAGGLGNAGDRIAQEQEKANQLAAAHQNHVQLVDQNIQVREQRAAQAGYMAAMNDVQTAMMQADPSLTQVRNAGAHGPGPVNNVAIASAEARCVCGPHTAKYLASEAVAAAGVDPAPVAAPGR